MSTKNLERLFRPNRIAVIGASEKPGSVGNTLMQNLLGSEYQGAVESVNPKHDSVHGIPARETVNQFEQPTAEMERRHCFIDYDREMAIVAERTESDDHQLIGVGRWIAGPDPETAEYALLVADAWQGKGLGVTLTEYCTHLASQWGIRQVVAQTESANTPMLATLRAAGFVVDQNESLRVVLARKNVSGKDGND